MFVVSVGFCSRRNRKFPFFLYNFHSGERSWDFKDFFCLYFSGYEEILENLQEQQKIEMKAVNYRMMILGIYLTFSSVFLPFQELFIFSDGKRK